jgi:hypothetical protein
MSKGPPSNKEKWMEIEYRVIPGYDGYCVDEYGTIKSRERNIILNQYLLNGYWIVDTFRGSLTETLPAHRAVGLAWVPNLDPVNLTIVNHLDGVPTNNYRWNLEWTDYSGNNYHAVNNGLRSDNIPCKVRDFYTQIVYDFSSIAQAAEFMGLRKDTPIISLRPKMFGKLVNDRYEFRTFDDPNPWFYEQRPELVPSSRYMVTVIEPNGYVNEVYSTRDLLKQYQLYGAPGKSIPALAEHGNVIYPDRRFVVRDSYAEQQHRTPRQTKGSQVMPINAYRMGDMLSFTSLTQTAKHFNVDRSSIMNRLNNGKELDGWTFTQEARL